MGSNLAYELSDKDLFPHLSLEKAIAIHLTSNHYPSVPLSMVQPCIDAIDAYNEEDYHKPIDLPEGVYWQNHGYAPASAIVKAHHLEAWLFQDED